MLCLAGVNRGQESSWKLENLLEQRFGCNMEKWRNAGMGKVQCSVVLIVEAFVGA